MAEITPIIQTVPNQEAIEAKAPTVRLAGADWPIPFLAPRQNRMVIPALLKAMPRLMGLAQLGEVSVEQAMAIMGGIDEATFGALLDAVYWALTRAHPRLDRQQFEDMPIGCGEMIVALEVIAKQTGLMVKAEPAKKQAKEPPGLGEEPAIKPSTGTA